MRTILLLCAVVSVGLLIVCDEPEKENVCDAAANITDAAMATACSNYDDCLLCACWNVGRTVDGTECGDVVTCDATAATDCVADETACASAVNEMVDTACASEL